MMSDLEFRRGIFHLVSGIIIVLLIRFEFLTKWLLLLLTLIALGISLVSKKYRIPFIYWFLEKFDRERDIKKFPGKGAFFYSLGVTLVVFLFPKDIALASIAVLAVADPSSRFIGIHFGKIRHPFNDAKFTEGAVAGIITGFLVAILFVKPSEAFFAAFFAMFAEGIELRLGMQHVDDNIVIPLVAGAVIWLVRILSTL
jgi:dolichol kinase